MATSAQRSAVVLTACCVDCVNAADNAAPQVPTAVATREDGAMENVEDDIDIDQDDDEEDFSDCESAAVVGLEQETHAHWGEEAVLVDADEEHQVWQKKKKWQIKLIETLLYRVNLDADCLQQRNILHAYSELSGASFLVTIASS